MAVAQADVALLLIPLAAIEAKRLRGDHRIDALERNLMSLERLVHDLQKDLMDIKKALRDG